MGNKVSKESVEAAWYVIVVCLYYGFWGSVWFGLAYIFAHFVLKYW